MLIIKNQKKYFIFLIALYFTLSLIGILNHEIWLDESHHWLLARDSTSLKNLIFNTRNEGHPIIWNVLLYYITRFTNNPFWMQFLHILISASTVFIFLFKAPFKLLFKTLFIFGYFVFYEYNIISRNYMLGVLFLFLALSLFKNRDKKLILISLLLTLSANVHAIFTVISFAVFLVLLFEKLQHTTTFKKHSFLVGSFIFTIGLLLSISQIIPENGSFFFSRIDTISFQEKIIPGAVSLFKGLFPLPDFRTIHFWNSNLIVNLSKPISGILSILVYLIPLLVFRKKNTLFFIYIALLGTQIFFFVTQMSATRYFGMAFIIFIVALWINTCYLEPKTIFKRYEKLRNFIIYGILITQCISGIIAFSMDVKYPFSSGKQIAEILESKNLLQNTIVTETCQGTTFSSDIKKKVYFLCDDSEKSFCSWNYITSCNFTNEEIINKLSNLVSKRPIIYVSKTQLLDSPIENIWFDVNNSLRVKLLAKMDPSVVRNVDYFIYKIKRKND